MMDVIPLEYRSNWLTIPTCCITCRRYVRHMPIAHTWVCEAHLVLPTKKGICAKAQKLSRRAAFYKFLKLHGKLKDYFMLTIKSLVKTKYFQTNKEPENYLSHHFPWGANFNLWESLDREWNHLLRKEYK